MRDNENVSTSNGCCDEELVALAAAGDAKALDEVVSRYKNLVRAKARKFFLAGADNDDIIQEGMIGLFKAIRDFRQSRQGTFSSFAELCVTRQIMSAIKSAARNKHLPLNQYISLNQPINDEEPERSLIQMVSEESASDPEALLLLKEQMATLNTRIKNELSSFEQSVFSLYLKGYSYHDISVRLKSNEKSVDNALQRIKRKLSRKNTTA